MIRLSDGLVRFLVILASLSGVAAAQNGFDIYRFPKGGERGFWPSSGLVTDNEGNLYGTTLFGGKGPCTAYSLKSGCGTVFRLTPPGTPGGAWKETVLYSFQGGVQDGENPMSGVIRDASGNLYGTTYSGGGEFCWGSVFQLSPPTVSGGAWTENILHCFDPGKNGDWENQPSGSLTFDTSGNLYGTTGYNQFGYGCDPICGSVFQVLRPTVLGGNWTELMLSGGGLIGEQFTGGVALDRDGNVYGAAALGGQVGNCTQLYQCGLVFELSPGNPWVPNILYEFVGGTDGMNPVTGLVFSRGKLYGVTTYGGTGACGWGNVVFGCGTVFELSPTTDGGWSENILYRFRGSSDGALPSASLAADPHGNLYGTTVTGGSGSCSYMGTAGCGTVFKLERPAAEGEAWTKTILMEFNQGTGYFPQSPLLYSSGAVYGTVPVGGEKCPTLSPATCGAVFKIIP